MAEAGLRSARFTSRQQWLAATRGPKTRGELRAVQLNGWCQIQHPRQDGLQKVAEGWIGACQLATARAM